MKIRIERTVRQLELHEEINMIKASTTLTEDEKENLLAIIYAKVN